MKRNRPLNEEKRKAIIDAAIQEFYAKGYEASSMDNISKEANVSKATVYNHFSNKEELFLSIAYSIKVKFEEVFNFKYDKDISIKEQLTTIAKKEIKLVSSAENAKILHMVTVTMILKNEVGIKLLESTKEDAFCVASSWFGEAKKDGKLHFDDSLFVAKQFIGFIKSFAFYPQLYGAPILSAKEQNNIVKKAVEMILTMYQQN